MSLLYGQICSVKGPSQYIKEVRRGYSLYLLIFNHFRGQTYYYTPEGPRMVNKRISYNHRPVGVIYCHAYHK